MLRRAKRRIARPFGRAAVLMTFVSNGRRRPTFSAEFSLLGLSDSFHLLMRFFPAPFSTVVPGCSTLTRAASRRHHPHMRVGRCSFGHTLSSPDQLYLESGPALVSQIKTPLREGSKCLADRRSKVREAPWRTFLSISLIACSSAAHGRHHLPTHTIYTLSIFHLSFPYSICCTRGHTDIDSTCTHMKLSRLCSSWAAMPKLPA